MNIYNNNSNYIKYKNHIFRIIRNYFIKHIKKSTNIKNIDKIIIWKIRIC